MKEFFVSLFVIIFVAAVVVFAFLPPKVYVTFTSVQNSNSLSEEQKQITEALNWRYTYNPLRVGREYQINMGSPVPLQNPEKQNYESFVRASVKSLSFVDETGAGNNIWSLVLAKERNGGWKIVADKLFDSQGVGEWY